VSRPGLPALMRLVRHSERWLIAYHPEGPYWSAEHVEGSRVRYLCAADTRELAEAIDRAEAWP